MDSWVADVPMGMRPMLGYGAHGSKGLMIEKDGL